MKSTLMVKDLAFDKCLDRNNMAAIYGGEATTSMKSSSTVPSTVSFTSNNESNSNSSHSGEEPADGWKQPANPILGGNLLPTNFTDMLNFGSK